MTAAGQLGDPGSLSPMAQIVPLTAETWPSLEALFRLPVDLVTPANLGNPYFRRRVEQEKTLLYAA